MLLAAFLLSRGCASAGRNVSQQEAIDIAKKQLDFTPRCAQVRYLRQGIQSRPVWAVSLWTLKNGQFDRVSVVLLSARNGRVISVTRRPNVQGTAPQCRSPV